MPILVDTNCLGNVFSRKSVRHAEFKPVLEWVRNGSGKFVYGGTTYLNEVPEKYLRILRYFKELNKVIYGDRDRIDEIEKTNKELITDPDFDDPHLIAIALVTRCKLICSEDKRSIKFVKNRIFYPKGVSPPAYYTSFRNINLIM